MAPSHPPMPAPDILDAAELLFARQGFHSTTIKAIAGAAGVNTALLYYYFADKQALYHAVLERAFGGLIAEGQGGTSNSSIPEAAIRAFVALQASYFGAHPNRPHLFVRELLDHGAEHAAGHLTRLAATLFRRLCDVIERGPGRGSVPRRARSAPGGHFRPEPGGLAAGGPARHRHPGRRRHRRSLPAMDRGILRSRRRVRAGGASPAREDPPMKRLLLLLPVLAGCVRPRRGRTDRGHRHAAGGRSGHRADRAVARRARVRRGGRLGRDRRHPRHAHAGHAGPRPRHPGGAAAGGPGAAAGTRARRAARRIAPGGGPAGGRLRRGRPHRGRSSTGRSSSHPTAPSAASSSTTPGPPPRPRPPIATRWPPRSGSCRRAPAPSVWRPRAPKWPARGARWPACAPPSRNWC